MLCIIIIVITIQELNSIFKLISIRLNERFPSFSWISIARNVNGKCIKHPLPFMRTEIVLAI